MTDKSLRKSIWSDPDTGEAYRDLDARLRSLNLPQTVMFKAKVYAPPIIIDTNGVIPAAIHVGTLRVPGSPTNLQPTISPLWDTYQGQVRINSIGGATVGTRYDMSFLLFYEAV